MTIKKTVEELKGLRNARVAVQASIVLRLAGVFGVLAILNKPNGKVLGVTSGCTFQGKVNST